MRKDYHLHPTVLQTPEHMEYFVQQALKKGIKQICITDHMPLSISNAADRIPKGKVREYCLRVCDFSEKYKDIIKIKCGIEIDYHPSVIGEIENVLSEGDFDYILASSHMHAFMKDFSQCSFNDFAKITLENSLKAVETGWFNAVAHLDMYRWVFENPKRFPLITEEYQPLYYETFIKELLRKIKQKNMFLEINPHFAETKGNLLYTYPQECIVEWALKEGVQFSYGSDAHAPQSVGALIEDLEKHPLYGKALMRWENDNEND